MRRLLLVMCFVSSVACAQAPVDLLRLAQDAYKNPDGYEIAGHGSVVLPGTDWQENFEVVVASAATPLGTPRAPGTPGGRVGGRPVAVNLRGDKNAVPPAGFMIPFGVTSFWSAIAERVESVKDVGTESLPLNGAAVACRKLEVEYTPRDDEERTAAVTYSICTDRHLVLKKTVMYATGRNLNERPALWTVVFDRATFNRPAPQWLLNLKDLPAVTVRKEWIGRAAPQFTLPSLAGEQVKLSTLRGKVVLLDFWSTSCPPCLREMPMVERIGAAHREDLVVWGISFDQPDRDRKWMEKSKRSLPTLSDVDFVASEAFKVRGIPAVVLVGRDGTIRNYWEGEVGEGELEAAIGRALRGK